MTLDTLIQEARKLSPAEQAELLAALILLVGPDSSDVTLTPAQQADLDRRITEYRAGQARIIDGDEAFARLRKRG